MLNFVKISKWRLWVKRCDECARLNPPIFEGNPRLCALCACPGGLYGGAPFNPLQPDAKPIRAIGKIGWWKLQLPYFAVWRGWWGR